MDASQDLSATSPRLSKMGLRVYGNGMTNLDERRRKLLYRATYRGFREADLLIGGFAAAHLATMSEAEVDDFEALLALPDYDLYAYAKGTAPAPANLEGPMLDRLRQFDIAAMIHG